MIQRPHVEYYYDEILFSMVNAGLHKLHINDCFWAIEITAGPDDDPYDGPVYAFMSPVPSLERWQATNSPIFDILRVKKIVFGESSKRLFGSKYTKAAELYVESARYGDVRQIINPYYKRDELYWYPLAHLRDIPNYRYSSSKKSKPKYVDDSVNIEYATKAEMVDFISYFREKRKVEQAAWERAEAEKLKKLQEEENNRNRVISKSLDDIWNS